MYFKIPVVMFFFFLLEILIALIMHSPSQTLNEASVTVTGSLSEICSGSCSPPKKKNHPPKQKHHPRPKKPENHILR